MATEVSACLGNKDEQKPDVSMFTRPIVSVDSAVHNPLPPHAHIFFSILIGLFQSFLHLEGYIRSVGCSHADDSGVTDRVDYDAIENDVCLRRA